MGEETEMTNQIEQLLVQISEDKKDESNVFETILLKKITAKIEEMKSGLMLEVMAGATKNSSELDDGTPISKTSVFNGNGDAGKGKAGIPLTKEEKAKLGEDLVEAVSRKDFQLAANTIKEISDPVKRQEAANVHAQIYAKSNPRFDHSKFHSACGTKG